MRQEKPTTHRIGFPLTIWSREARRQGGGCVCEVHASPVAKLRCPMAAYHTSSAGSMGVCSLSQTSIPLDRPGILTKPELPLPSFVRFVRRCAGMGKVGIQGTTEYAHRKPKSGREASGLLLRRAAHCTAPRSKDSDAPRSTRSLPVSGPNGFLPGAFR